MSGWKLFSYSLDYIDMKIATQSNIDLPTQTSMSSSFRFNGPTYVSFFSHISVAVNIHKHKKKDEILLNSMQADYYFFCDAHRLYVAAKQIAFQYVFIY